MNTQELKQYIMYDFPNKNINFYEIKSDNSIVLEAEIDYYEGFKAISGDNIKRKIQIIINDKYIIIEFSLLDTWIRFDMNKIQEKFDLRDTNGIIQTIKNEEQTWSCVFDCSAINSGEDFFYDIFDWMYLTANAYCFGVACDFREKEHEELAKYEKMILNDVVNMKLLKALEKMIVDSMKERFLKLVDNKENLTNYEGDIVQNIKDKYYSSNDLIDYVEGAYMPEVGKRLLQIMFEPWNLGNYEIYNLIRDNDGDIQADSLICGLYFAFSGARSVGAKELLEKTNIKEIEDIVLNYVVEGIVNDTIEKKDIEELIEELQVVNNMSRRDN